MYINRVFVCCPFAVIRERSFCICICTFIIRSLALVNFFQNIVFRNVNGCIFKSLEFLHIRRLECQLICRKHSSICNISLDNLIFTSRKNSPVVKIVLCCYIYSSVISRIRCIIIKNHKDRSRTVKNNNLHTFICSVEQRMILVTVCKIQTVY